MRNGSSRILGRRFETNIPAACARELIEAVQYYNAQRIRIGDEFRDEAWETLRRINDFPLAWHPLGGSIRRCQMQRFPYGPIYEPTDVEIIIIAVVNAGRIAIRQGTKSLLLGRSG